MSIARATLLPPCLCLSGALLLAGPARAAQSVWSVTTGLPPNAVPSPYTLVDTADPEDPVVGGGLLTIETSDAAETIYYIQAGASLALPDPWVIEFEMRHVSGSSQGSLRGTEQVFLTTAPGVGTLFQIDADSIFLLVNDATLGDSATVDTDDAFHTYRIEVSGSGAVDVYYDDVLTLQGATYTDLSAHGSVPRVAFGAGSIASFGTSEWMSFTHDGLATSTDGQINVNIAGTGANPMLPSETGGAPAVNDDNWNDLGGTTVAAGPLDLVGGDGLPITGATAAWTANGQGILNDGGGTDDAHLRSTNFDTQAYPAVDVTVTGIPFAFYDVYAYHEGGAPAGLSRVARFNIDGMDRFARRPEDVAYSESTATSDAGPATEVGNYVVFRGLTSPSVTLTAGGASSSDATPRNRFMALQIVESSPPTTTSSTTTTSSITTTSSSTSTTATTATTTTTAPSSTSTTTTVTSTTTTTTTLGGTTLLPPGKKLLVKQKKSGTQRLQLLAKDPSITSLPSCDVDGELVIEAVGAAAPVRRYALDAEFWKPINAKKPERGCKYRKGPVVATVLVKSGKALKVIANAPDLGIPLATDPRPVRIELRHGDVRHCVEFGGSGPFKIDKKVLSRKAEPADSCP